MKAKLIVIEGSDGSGKATQLKLLGDYFKSKGEQVSIFDFPRYQTFLGQLIKDYQYGEYGPTEEVNPYLISLAYALDRCLAKEEIKKALEEGQGVLTNRYAYSNMAHQGAKLKKEQRESFVNWDYQLEFAEIGLPKEDITFYLHVSVANIQKLMAEQGRELDQHESNAEHLKAAEEMYNLLAQKFNFVTIQCVKKGSLRTKEDIHQEIINKLKEKGLL